MLVNGSPTNEFPMERGLRQADLLSPFIFIIAMEGLSALIRMAVEKGLFNGLQLPNNGPIISHTLYADDVLFLGEWDHHNLLNLKRILGYFYFVSGIRINYHKYSLMGTGCSEDEVMDMAEIMGCRLDQLPFQHLGLPLGANMKLRKHWESVIKKFKDKLSSWEAKNLSFGGRLTLVKSVFGSVPLYFFLYI